MDSDNSCSGSVSSGDPQSDQSQSETQASSTHHSIVHTTQQDKCIRYFKWGVVGILLCTALVVTMISLHSLSETEDSMFESEFESYARDVLASSKDHVDYKLNALKSLSAHMTGHTIDAKESWPNVTLPFFAREVEDMLKLSGAGLVGFTPIVKLDQKAGWEEYAVQHQGWLRQSLDFRGQKDVDIQPIPEHIHGNTTDVMIKEKYMPLWQMAPAPLSSEPVNLDFLSIEAIDDGFETASSSKSFILTKAVDLSFLMKHASVKLYERQPRSMLIVPIFESFDTDAEVVGFVFAVIPWESYFNHILPEGEHGIVVKVEDTCGSLFYYQLEGPHALPVTQEIEEETFSDVSLSESLVSYDHAQSSLAADSSRYCEYTVTVLSTPRFRDLHDNDNTLRTSVIIAVSFFICIAVFLIYDAVVKARQRSLEIKAAKTSALVDSLFPEGIQQRLMQDEKERRKSTFKTSDNVTLDTNAGMSVDGSDDGMLDKKLPIADIIPEVTILFADLVGFTAWSSAREPHQVFILLETIYGAFDKIAKRRGVFKVETVGDCYVAATGIPTYRKDHAVVMARFASDCLHKMQKLVRDLEVKVGPDTADLGMRVGIHSGPVTAGVLRGERARFQLFGDTMNTTSRIESGGKINRIHVSEETAALVTKAGKGHWLTERKDVITAKGKGQLKTFWLSTKTSETTSSTSDSQCSDDIDTTGTANLSEVTPVRDQKCQRMIDWNTDILCVLLSNIHSNRLNGQSKPEQPKRMRVLEIKSLDNTQAILHEVKDFIELPERTTMRSEAAKAVLDEEVRTELHDFVTSIASMYRENPFHNFEHASHVTMSVNKLLSRIVAPTSAQVSENEGTLHDHTFGITSDPLTQFAVVLAALIHDVDHPGVPNAQLVLEKTALSEAYNNQSIAEQNSIDLAWRLLMDDKFSKLRAAIYSNESELTRFRQLVVNAVIATDIADKELKTQRQLRWDAAFAPGQAPKESADRRATIVIEHMIQASDIAHTMQHWHIYRKWNKRLFQEMRKAFKEGRAEKDPAEFWYRGEIGFFDFYIIPLAKKLKECGVFGVSSDEYLNYAMNNRKEWEARGEEILADMVEELE